VALVLCAGFALCAVAVLWSARRVAPTTLTTASVESVDSFEPATTRVTAGESGTAAPTTAGGSAPTTTTTTAPTSTTTDVGALPQTDTEPTTSTPAFKAGSAALWQAVVHDDPDRALPFFFPESAYRQVKDIGDPDGDWNNRLVANFRTDVHALHQQLGTLPAGARFERLDVPEGQAQWITPGVEFNKGSYWRVYGSRLLYTAGGVERSLPVSSLISWRGEWYVVHLGAIR
jgi:hypothetical protein